MKLTTRQDIEAPIAFVYAALTDFEGWERAAMRRGAEVSRSDAMQAAGPGMAWNVQFTYRAKPRRLKLKLTGMEQTRLGFFAEGDSVQADAAVNLVELAPKRTRITISVEMAARTLAARLFLQSLRLAKGKVTRKFDERVSQLAADIEDRFRRAPRRA